MRATRRAEDTDPTTVCRLEIYNHVTGKRGRFWVMKSFTEVVETIMSCMVEIDPVTDKLEWIDDDPLCEAAFGSCVHVPMDRSEPIRIVHYATRGRRAALCAMKKLAKQFPK